MSQTTPPQTAEAPVSRSPELVIHGSRQWVSWQAEQGISVVFSTYQSSKLFLIGLKQDGNLSVFERTFPHCMGLATQGDSLYMGSQYQLWRLNNVLPAGTATPTGFDKSYVPNVSWVTGDVDAHDVGVLPDGRPVFVNTLFSCIATVDESSSFRPIWQPPFISKLVPEDRCHLNGLAMVDGQPRYASAVSQTDVHEGWRDHRVDGGVVMDIHSNEVICQGLSMPHSPRWYRDQLWVLNSGCGEFGKIDLNTGKFEAIAFCPGYARGLAFYGDYALIGLSKPRENRTFTGLPLDQRLADAKVQARCAIAVVDLRNGAMSHTLSIDGEGIVEELFDVAVLPSVRCPSAVGFKTDEIRRTINIGEPLSKEDLLCGL